MIQKPDLITLGKECDVKDTWHYNKDDHNLLIVCYMVAPRIHGSDSNTIAHGHECQGSTVYFSVHIGLCVIF